MKKIIISNDLSFEADYRTSYKAINPQVATDDENTDPIVFFFVLLIIGLVDVLVYLGFYIHSYII